ncbi:MAG: hydrogenase maturation protease [Candidatus Lustribacter sp.]
MQAVLAIDAPVLVLGYGNSGRQDDGLGCAAAEAIADLGLAGVRTSAKYQLAIDDAYDASECAAVIFVDASKSAAAPFSVEPVVASTEPAFFASHDVRPEFILSLCRRVYGCSPDARVIGIRGYAFGFDEGLTAPARENLDAAVAYIRGVLHGRDACAS